MATYVGAGVQNPYSSGVTGGTIAGDAATGALRRDLGKYVDALEAYDTPTYEAVPKRGTATQIKHEWGVKTQRPLRTTLGAQLTAGGTTMTVATGFGPNLMKYMVFKIIDATNGDEIVWSSQERNDGADTITILRAQGGTTDVTHASASVVEILGTAEPLTGPDHPVSPIIYGSQAWNAPQRFVDSFKIDRVANATPDLEKPADKIAYELEEVARIQKIEVNKTLLRGGRQAGAPSTPTASMMGGIGFYLSTNVTNLSGATYSLFNIDDITSTAWGTYRNKVARKIWVNLNMKRILSRLYMPFREGRFDDTSVNTVINKMTFETGTYELVVDPYMPDGEIWGIDTSGMSLMPYMNNDWHSEDLAVTGSYFWKALVGVFTFEFNNEPLSWRVYGGDTTLANYPTIGL